MQRDKGKRGELQVRDLFREAGFDCDRTPNSGGLRIPADLHGDTGGLHVEVKWQERISLLKWIRQAEADAPDDEEPVVFWRKSRMEWRADVDARFLLALLADKRSNE